MDFVDRNVESARLNELLNAKHPSFVIVRGRRRIGKSTLIKRVLKETDIYFEADCTNASEQIRQLAAVIAHRFPGFNDAEYRDWRTALSTLNYRATERFTLCLDEFPYLVEKAPSLPSIIQGLLDSKELKYHLILCGSSQTMMYNLTHDESSPLYGRGDADFNMRPIGLPYMQQALDLDAIETIENYAVLGGVPRYWLLRENARNLRETIDTHIFSPLGILFEEPQRLFKDDMNDAVKTATIMSIVGSGANKLSEIASRSSEPATNLSRPMAKLVDLGYLEKDTPFGESAKDSKKNLYRIADPFLSFHYRFVTQNKSFIELGRKYVLDAAIEKGLPSHIGYWWERTCRNAVSGNVIDGVIYGEARRWWGKVFIDNEWKDIELDVVAESLDHNTILIGECKWTNGENGRLLTNELLKIAKALPFCQNKKIKNVLFTKVRPEENQGNALLPEDVIRLLGQ